MSYRSMLSAGKSKRTYCNVKSFAEGGPDGQGGFLGPTWTIIHRRILCRFNSLTTKEMQVLHDKQAVQADYTVYLEYVSGTKEGDRLVKLGDSREFEVKLKMDWDEDNQMLKLACKEEARLV